MASVVFLDEAGDLSLENIDKSFPVFTLMLVVADKEEYVSNIVPSVVRLKLDFWQHEGIILHSRDIRRAHGDFAILSDATLRSRFMAGVSNLMTVSKYDLISVSIDKEKLGQNDNCSANPYSLSLAFALERLIMYLEGKKLEPETQIVAEARGGKEDKKLLATFNQIVSNGTAFCSAESFRRHNLKLLFRAKQTTSLDTRLLISRLILLLVLS